MKKLFFLMAASFLFAPVHAQITERERPAEWQHLVKGARFMDGPFPSDARRYPGQGDMGN